MVRNRIRSGIMYPVVIVIFIFLSVFAISVFAEQPRTRKGFTYNLKRLIDDAKKTVRKIDDELEKEEIEKRNRQREAKVKEHFEKGKTLYRKGKPKEAKKQLLEAIRITKDPEMEGYIKESEREAMEEKRAREKKERKRRRQLEAEKRKKARLEAKRAREEELTRKKEAEVRKRGLLKEEKEKERLERERQQELEKERRRIERKERRKERKKGRKEGRIERERIKVKELPFKTKKECLDVLGKKPKDKKTFDNLVELYRLVNKHLKKGKTLYKKRKWNEAITEYRKALAIDPDNKEAIRFIKKANTKLRGNKGD